MPTLPGPVNLYEQAARSLNYLQGAVDYWQNCTPFFWVKFKDGATWLQHNHWDHSENPGRFLYGTVLSRIVLGLRDELPVEKCFKQQIYDSILPGEALSFRPNPSPYEMVTEAADTRADHVRRRKDAVMEANLWDNRSVVTGLVLNAVSTGDEGALAAAGRMVDAVKKLAVREGDCATFTRMSYPPGYDVKSSSDEKVVGQNMGGWIRPLVFFHRETADDGALELAAGLARTFVETFPMPVARERELPVRVRTNVHGFLHLIAGVVRVYRVTGEDALLRWANEQFDAVLTSLASRTGWTMEFLPSQNYHGVESCETCALADRIDAGIQLALAGFPEYWNDVQRCVFNYLSEAQFKDTSWLPVDPRRRDDFYRSFHNIRERLVGAYVGWGAPNDLVEPDARVPGSVQNCCGPHGAFGAYQAWHHAVQRNDDGVYVNLLLSRDSPWCSVVSGQPASDVIEVTMKCDGPLYVRIPDWAGPDALEVHVNGEPARAVTDGCYVRMEAASGDVVELSIPQPETEIVEVLSGREYRTTWKGDFVTGIEPRGTVAPLFERNLRTAGTGKPDWPPLIDEIEW